MGFYGALGVDWQQRLFTTHMNEDDVVMGDVTRLEEAIVELDKSYEPKVILSWHLLFLQLLVLI